MSIKLRQLRYAVATADAQSFSRAVATRGVKQSALSCRVMLLEQRLGVKLFERTTREAEPTDNVRDVTEQIRRIFTDIDNIQTTGYHNGPGAITYWPRPSPSIDPKAPQQALVPTGDTFNGTATPSETHGGEDVPVYAIGEGSDGVRGVIEQNRIFNIIMSALGHDR